MKFPLSASETLLAAIVLGGVTAFAWSAFGPWGSSEAQAVSMPTLSPVAQAGKPVFEKHCAQCHGVNAVGTKQGPPLLHDIYNPGHHPDGAFVAAVRRGVGQHHWPFGNMPAQPQVTDAQVTEIVRFVRELQQANGISYRPHRM